VRASPPNDALAALTHRVHENVESIAELTAQHERKASVHQLRLERAARFVGRPATLVTVIAAAIAWIAINTEVLAHPIDHPPFFWLQGALAFYAAVVSTLVLIAQSRQTAEAQHREQVELHINLLAEQKATKIISLLEELRRDLPNVRDRVDPGAEAFTNEVDPRLVDEVIKSSRR
jgi:uncharacterized membrane protein